MEESDSGKEKKKMDIKMLVSIIPPATSERKSKILLEKRVRARRRDDVKKGECKINPKLASTLNISDYMDLIVAGKKRLVLKVILLDSVPENEVWCNLEELREQGIADNSIVTIRRSMRRQV